MDKCVPKGPNPHEPAQAAFQLVYIFFVLLVYILQLILQSTYAACRNVTGTYYIMVTSLNVLSPDRSSGVPKCCDQNSQKNIPKNGTRSTILFL